MPRVPDASAMTTYRRVNATFNPDPTNKSRTFVSALRQGYLSAELRASDVQRTIAGSVLATPGASAPPAPPAPLPRVEIDCDGTDFNNVANPLVEYLFENVGGVPPASSFEAVLTNVVNPGYVGAVSVYDDSDRGLLGTTTIAVSPVWTGSTIFQSNNDAVLLFRAGTTPAFPTNAVITFANVPIVSGLTIMIESVYR